MFTGSNLSPKAGRLLLIAGWSTAIALVIAPLAEQWITPESPFLPTLENCAQIRSIATTAFATTSEEQLAGFRADLFILNLGICDQHFDMLRKSE